MNKQKTLIIEKSERNPMQSMNSKDYFIGVLSENENDLDESLNLFPVMNWISSKNMIKQSKFRFENENEAREYAEKNGLNLVIKERKTFIKPQRKKTYSENFQ